MSWTVLKEDENGNVLDSSLDEFSIKNLEFLLKSNNFTLLQYLNPFGDTTFNSNQIDDLISDLILLKSLKSDNSKKIEKIIEVAESCKNDVHSYLKFYGD
ncbi:MAG TPA: hypothetical protein VEC36_09090 [Patescibacteria group bacterium]|nr:hypothetical protein [Patescibacteria group bacterium]